MNPDLLLSVIAAFAGFALKTTAAFGVCLILQRLVESAHLRFLLWTGFLYGSAAYWLFLVKSVLAWREPATAALLPLSRATVSTVGAWQIPDSWALSSGFALRGIGIVYLLILSYMLFAYIRKLRHLKWVLSFTSEPPVEIAEVFQPLAKKLNVSRSRLLVLAGATSPATFGWVRPIILLPTVCLDQDRSELQDVLLHELHHVRRLDSVWNGLAMAGRALLFFHPAAWYAVKKMQFDRELACDFAVISQSPARKGKYAECLIRFARLNLIQDAQTWGIDFAASAELAVRVHSILAVSRKTPAWVLCSRAACGLAISALFVGVVPSLAVLVSYAHRPISPTLSADTRGFLAGTASAPKTTRRVRGVSSPVSRAAESVTAGQAEDLKPALESPALQGTENLSSRQSNSGPLLVHRGSAAPNLNRPQSIALIDTDAAESGKTIDPDRKQALQQTATAVLGLYKRVSDIDRR